MDSPSAKKSWLENLVANPKVRATYASLVGHVAVLLVLAWLATSSRETRPPTIRFSLAAPDAQTADEVEIQVPLPAEPTAHGASHAASAAETAALLVASEPVTAADQAMIEAVLDAPTVPGEPMVSALAVTDITSSPELTDPANRGVDQPSAPARDAGLTAFAGRRGEARSRGVTERGGSAASEAAVERGLEWLARHQAADGSWRFDLSGCRCDGACSHPGTVTSTTAATGIAILPFLGAGHTHMEGAYRETVTRGLYYLMSRMRPSPRGGDLAEGTMYGHGVATLALAEAFGMTSDPMLAPYVRDAIRFIETSQDLHGGGWRYLPGQAGDTTVTAWQIAALKSAAIAGVAVPSPTIDAACRFLDRVQVRNGEGYGYLSPQDRSCTSAVGLLCRIYTAWPDGATLDRGLARLARSGPPPEAVYQNFYLAQALLLRNHGTWRRWNVLNRDHLVARQARVGHESGSWTFVDADTAPGGRLGHTALAVLTLEVYYRVLPIYRDEAARLGW